MNYDLIRAVSSEGLHYLTVREGGMRLDVHDDGYGFATVGVGHLVMDEDNLEIGDKIDKHRARLFLQSDLFEARKAVSDYCGNSAIVQDVDYYNQHQFDALSIFTFNIGVTAFRTSTLVKRLKAGEDKNLVVTEEMPRWKYVNGQYSRGLKNRRIDTVQMFTDGDYTVDWEGLEGQDNGKGN